MRLLELVGPEDEVLWRASWVRQGPIPRVGDDLWYGKVEYRVTGVTWTFYQDPETRDCRIWLERKDHVR